MNLRDIREAYVPITILNQEYNLFEMPIENSAFDDTFSTIPNGGTLPPVQLLLLNATYGQVLNVFTLVASVERPNEYSIIPRVADMSKAFAIDLIVALQTQCHFPMGLTLEHIASVKRYLFLTTGAAIGCAKEPHDADRDDRVHDSEGASVQQDESGRDQDDSSFPAHPG